MLPFAQWAEHGHMLNVTELLSLADMIVHLMRAIKQGHDNVEVFCKSLAAAQAC